MWEARCGWLEKHLTYQQFNYGETEKQTQSAIIQAVITNAEEIATNWFYKQQHCNCILHQSSMVATHFILLRVTPPLTAFWKSSYLLTMATRPVTRGVLVVVVIEYLFSASRIAPNALLIPNELWKDEFSEPIRSCWYSQQGPKWVWKWVPFHPTQKQLISRSTHRVYNVKSATTISISLSTIELTGVCSCFSK